MAHPLIFLQWNVRSITPRKSDLTYLINKFKPSICGIAETWLLPDSNFRLPCFGSVRNDRTDGYGGCALLINSKVSYSQIPLTFVGDDINVVAVKAEDIYIFSFYVAHPKSEHLSVIKNLLCSVSGPTLVMGDFNCHHYRWGSDSCDNFGIGLLDILDDLDLCLINDGSATRRSAPGQCNSCVDLTFCSSGISSLLIWRRLEMTHGSDHYPIIIEFPSKNIPIKVSPPLLKHQLNMADWDLYSKIVDLRISSLPKVDSHNAHECFSSFSSTISSTADDCFLPKKTPSGRLPPPPWWDRECTDMIKARNEAEKTVNRDMNLDNLITFKQMLAKSRKFLKKKKREGWSKYCSSLSPSTPVSTVWRKLKRFRSSLAPASSNNITEELGYQFFTKIAPAYVPSVEECSVGMDDVDNTADPMNIPFSLDELRSVLSHVRDSAPGVDGFTYSFISKAGPKTHQYYLDLANFCFTSGYIPKEWKVQVVIPILKPGKDPSDHCSYRPIALSSILIKLLEHLVKNRLEWLVENGRLLPPTQFGFRKGLGTADSVGILTSAVRLALSRNESVVVVFLDISAAYDSVLLPNLRQKLQKLRIPARICRVIGSIFTDRTIQLRIPGADSDQRTVWRGLPQGSVLSPPLYNIYTADLSSSLNFDCDILQYADDIALMVCGSSIQDAAHSMNVSLSSLNQWLLDHGLSLSAPKSTAVIFTRKRSVPPIDINIDGQIIPVKDKARFLGVILDSRLTGIDHINNTVKKCERSVSVLKALAGVWWGAHPYTLKLVYNALTRSAMDYCSFLVEPCNKEALKRLDGIQAKCLRIVIGAMKSSPINALQVECAEPPLNHRRQYLADRFLSKVFSLSSHPLLPILEQINLSYNSSPYWKHKTVPLLINRYRELKQLSAPICQYPTLPVFSSAYESIHYEPKAVLGLGISRNSQKAKDEFELALKRYWVGWNFFYTDASKLTETGNTGVAVYFQNSRIALLFQCPPEASVFTGECIGILEAIHYIKSHQITRSVIFSDSLSSIQALKQNQLHSKIHSQIIVDIKNLLFDCSQNGLDIEITWIPGHSGIVGNECADSLAKYATSNPVDRKHYVVHNYDLRNGAKPKLFSSWTETWKTTSKTKGRYYAAIQPEIQRKPWFFKCPKLAKRTVSSLCRLRLGHCCSPVFLNKIHVRDSSLCECGLADGTLDHIFFSCPLYNKSFDLYRKICMCNIPLPTNFHSLLSHFSPKLINILGTFMNENDLKF
ncbi:hypothetical protein PYW07_013825 [Mythimna separata]|uniref:Uncharacterized protein n=1 Tax=Mythimna separata TaxID=271217 RepID=A0AAD7YFF0_MYTSE|nr:hypothetical protein PYW07_013825 [Mythimna separata]